VESVHGDDYWWGGNLKGVRTTPIAITHMDKRVYSAHEYGPEAFEQPWFSDESFPSNMPIIRYS
jgi:endoglucanase